jgi:hypothetical protein
MMSLLAHGCPCQAIVATYDIDERTLASWGQASGQHCRTVHTALTTPLDLGQVQADELRVKAQHLTVWVAMVPQAELLHDSGLVVRLPDIVPLAESLILTLAETIKQWAFRLRNRPLVLVFDGFAAYVTVVRRVFRCAIPSGAQGRPPLVAWPNIFLGQVIKGKVGRRLVVPLAEFKVVTP